MPTWDPRANELFLKALVLISPGERREYLDGACGGDAALRAEVEALLRANAEAGSFLAAPAAGLPPPPGVRGQADNGAATIDEPTRDRPLREGPGTKIGPYKLLEQIGEGGFGVVFLAEQTQPVRRKVALKVLKPGMDTREVVARFEAERQALALMDHPNIARVLDGGTTGEPGALATGAGRPYFVMELVRGVAITDFCDQGRLGVRRRLELFVSVCQAVQHAHQKGIIHRDIKPSNVLVTRQDDRDVVKVIDFGIAKALGQELTDKTLVTQFAEVIGTPLYMSPEQAGMSGLDIDTRSDVYSLGVLLYELLTGTTPFDKARLGRANFEEIRRAIREEEPPRPSTRMSTAGQAATTASQKRQSDPRRLSRMYRGELDWVVMKALEKDRNRRYETAAAFAADVERYLADEPVQARPPSAWYRLRKFARRNKRALATVVLLLAAVAALAGGLGWSMWTKALRGAGIEREVTLALAESEDLQARAKWPEALAAAEKAQAALASGEGGEGLHRRVRARLRDMRMLVRLEESVYGRKGIWAERRISKRRVGGRTFTSLDREGNWGPADPRVEGELAKAFDDFGIPVEQLDAGEAARRIQGSGIAVELAAALHDWAAWRKGIRPRDDRSWKHLLAVARAADPDEWRNRLRDALVHGDRDALEKLAGQDATLALPAISQYLLADALRQTGALDTGLALLKKVQRQHPGDFWLNFYLGLWLQRSGRPKDLDGAIRFYQAALAVRPQMVNVLLNLGDALHDKGNPDEAIAIWRKCAGLQKDCFLAYLNLGCALHEKGLYEEAVTAFEKALRLRPRDGSARVNLAITLARQSKFDKAIAELKHAIELRKDDAAAWYNLGAVLWDKKEPAASIPYFKEAVRLEPDEFLNHMSLAEALHAVGLRDRAVAAYRDAFRHRPQDAVTLRQLGATFAGRGLHAEAVTAYRDAFRLERRDARSLLEIGVTLEGKGLADQAIAAYREAIRLQPELATAHYNLGVLLLRLGSFEAAITANREAVRLRPDYAEAHCNLGLALRGAGRFTEALAELKRGHELGSARPDWHYPSAQWVKDCARLVQQARPKQDPAPTPQVPGPLARILRGELRPVDAGERAEFARLCLAHGYNAAAARLCQEGFEDLGAPARYLAACAAALAGAGQGRDADKLDEKERARWRDQALAWLRPELDRMQQGLKKDPGRWRARVLEELQRWQADPRLAAVREGQALDRLTPAERAAWRKLWADVLTLLARVRSAS